MVNRIGSGFQDGPPSVTRSRWAISWPQRIQAQGSYVGVEGTSRLIPASSQTAGDDPRHLHPVAVAQAPADDLSAGRAEDLASGRRRDLPRAQQAKL